MLMSYGVIGDAHLGFKAYDSAVRTEECTWCFEQAVKLLYDKGIRTIFQVGDLIDDTTWPNWVEKSAHAVFNKYSDVNFIILGGNHDSTKTYTSVSALDVLEERHNITIHNSFKIEYGNGYIAIPHMKSQKEFREAVLSIDTHVDMCMLHSMTLSKLELGPNDLNIDQEMLDHLAKYCEKVFIGHQHSPVIISDKVYITGSTMELNFGELGPRFVYIVDEAYGVELVPIPQPRLMERIDISWSGVNDLLDRLHDLSPTTIYKIVVNYLPHSEYSICLAAIESVCVNFSGDLIYDLIKVGHEEIEISTIDANFDLITEFKHYCDDVKALAYLEEAIAELVGEEDDN